MVQCNTNHTPVTLVPLLGFLHQDTAFQNCRLQTTLHAVRHMRVHMHSYTYTFIRRHTECLCETTQMHLDPTPPPSPHQYVAAPVRQHALGAGDRRIVTACKENKW